MVAVTSRLFHWITYTGIIKIIIEHKIVARKLSSISRYLERRFSFREINFKRFLNIFMRFRLNANQIYN